MEKQPQDIYSSREKRDPEPPGRPDSAMRWIRAIEQPWSAVVTFILLLLLVGILAAVVYRQHRGLERMRESRSLDRPVMTSVFDLPAPPMAVDEQGRILLDELSDIGAVSLPRDGVKSLSASWVIQAALRLRQAERAVELGDWSAALAAYEDARRILPGIDHLEESIGLCHLRLKQYDRAEAVFSALSERAKSAGLLNNLGVSLMGQDKTDRAETALREAVAADPEYLPARQNLGLLFHRTGDMAQAVETLADAIHVGADNHEIRLMYAATLLTLGRWKDGASVLEELAKSIPTAPVLFHLSAARLRMGQTNAALKAMREGLNLVDARAAAQWIERPEFDALREHPEFVRMATDLAPTTPRTPTPSEVSSDTEG